MKTVSLLTVVGIAAMAFQGTAAFAQTATLEQAKDLVHRGRAALRKDGCAKTFNEITNGTTFRDPAHKELYLYVYDEKLKNLAHGGNAKLVGKDLWDMKDMKG